jgi:predicted RNase H-like nuclease (RuvC/YqgF family)
MTTMNRSTRTLAIVALVAAVALAAPAVWAQKSQQKAGESIQQFRASVLGIKTGIDSTIEALNGVMQSASGGDTKTAVKKYSEQIKAMQKHIDKTKSYSEKMKAQGQAYFKEWEEKMGAVSNPEMKAKATERRAQLQAEYDKVQGNIAQAKETASNFWKDLQDLDKVYQADSSPNGIKGTADMVTKAGTDATTVKGFLDQVVAAVDKIMAEMGVAPEK